MHVVVDGSNLATEGRTLPSLKQLIEGVLDFRGENPDAEVVVVVDATFGHRIDDAERPLFEDAIVHQEIVSPPAGAIGRGDAFVLRIAEKVGATVLSNDSFQEFHAEHEWLFDQGRLIGGKPVPGIGWIFTPRTPVRGPRSREATQEAKRKQRKSASTSEAAPLLSGAELLEKGKAALDKLPKARRDRDKPKKDEVKGREPKKDDARHQPAEPPAEAAASGPRRNRRSRGPVEDAIALATVEAVVPDADTDDEGGGKRRKRRRKAAPAEPVNEPGVFLELVAAYRPGDLVEGEVEEFSSHGAFVTVRGTRCYIPLSLMADPAPRAARDVLKRGEVRTFVLRAFDAARRGVELALPGTPLPVGPVSEETAAAAVGAEAPDEPDAAVAVDEIPRRGRRKRKTAAPTVEAAPVAAPAPVADAEPAPTRGRRTRKAAPPAMEATQLTVPLELPQVPGVADVPTPRRRTKAATATVPAEPVTVDGAAPAPAAASSVDEAPTPAAVAAGPRRRVRKVALASEPGPVEVAASVDEAPTPAPVAAGPRRRVRKVALATEPGPVEEAAPLVEAPSPAPEERGVPTAPAGPRRRTKKVAGEVVTGAPVPAQEAVTPPRPALRTRTRAVAATPPADAEAPATKPRSRAPKSAPPAEMPPAVEAAPRSRGSRKAMVGIAQPAATLAGNAEATLATAEAASAPKPARKRTATRVAAPTPVEPEPAAPTPAPTKFGTRRTAAAPTPTAATSEPAAPAKPRAKKAATKKAAPKKAAVHKAAPDKAAPKKSANKAATNKAATSEAAETEEGTAGG